MEKLLTCFKSSQKWDGLNLSQASTKKRTMHWDISKTPILKTNFEVKKNSISKPNRYRTGIEQKHQLIHNSGNGTKRSPSKMRYETHRRFSKKENVVSLGLVNNAIDPAQKRGKRLTHIFRKRKMRFNLRARVKHWDSAQMRDKRLTHIFRKGKCGSLLTYFVCIVRLLQTKLQ